MPIEIRELYIKAVIDAGGSSLKAEPAVSSATGEAQPETGQGMEQIVDLCVEKVLEILKDKQER